MEYLSVNILCIMLTLGKLKYANKELYYNYFIWPQTNFRTSSAANNFRKKRSSPSAQSMRFILLYLIADVSLAVLSDNNDKAAFSSSPSKPCNAIKICESLETLEIQKPNLTIIIELCLALSHSTSLMPAVFTD